MNGDIIGAVVGLGGLIVAALSLWISARRENRNEKRTRDAKTISGMATLVQETRASLVQERKQHGEDRTALREEHEEDKSDLKAKHESEIARLKAQLKVLIGG